MFSAYQRGGRNDTRKHDTVGTTNIAIGNQNLGRGKQRRKGFGLDPRGNQRN